MSGASSYPRDPELSNLAAALFEATDRLDEARERSAQASRDETSARNAVNEAQRAFDLHIEMLRGAAHRDTDWGRELVTGRCVPVEAG